MCVCVCVCVYVCVCVCVCVCVMTSQGHSDPFAMFNENVVNQAGV